MSCCPWRLGEGSRKGTAQPEARCPGGASGFSLERHGVASWRLKKQKWQGHQCFRRVLNLQSPLPSWAWPAGRQRQVGGDA